MKRFGLGSLCFVALAVSATFAITPNANLSAGKNLYISGKVNSKNPGAFTDGHVGQNSPDFEMSDIALKVGEGPTKLFITWETRGDESWVADEYITTICKHTGAPMSNFTIQTSANSTNGVNGDWEDALQVTGNLVMSRGVEIDFAGKSWFRIVSKDKVSKFEEVGAYDMSNGGDDTWFFLGTSITQCGLKMFEVDSTFSDLIHARFPAYTPAMVRGGIACVNTTQIMDGIQVYMDHATSVKYWAIEMGTNDAWGDVLGLNVETFTRNMQVIIDSAKAHGITPIIARMMATNPPATEENWQVNPRFLDAIDSLVEVNNLPKGPDFYNYFLNHPEELSAEDGVHPLPSGAQSMQRLWAEAVAPLYASSGSSGIGVGAKAAQSSNARFKIPQIQVEGRSIRVKGTDADASVSIVTPMGQVMQSASNLPSGNYMVVVRSRGNSVTARVQIK